MLPKKVFVHIINQICVSSKRCSISKIIRILHIHEKSMNFAQLFFLIISVYYYYSEIVEAYLKMCVSDFLG